MQLAGQSGHAAGRSHRCSHRSGEHAALLGSSRPDAPCCRPTPAAWCPSAPCTTSAAPGSRRSVARVAVVASVQSGSSNGQPQQPGMMAGPSGAAPGAGALVRRPSLAPVAPPVQAQMVYIDMSQVVGKRVITTSTGRDLGVVSCMWVDPARGEVVSMDLDDKKGVGAQRVANIGLSRLTQIGDVVLVQDESVLYDQPLDGRFGYVVLAGMEVRSRSGDFLGKVRDFSFSPDNGALAKVTYDDFGLSFLPVNFFDTYSISMGDVLAIGPVAVTVMDEAKYRERKETSGLFAAIPSLLRSINTGSVGGRAPAGLLGTSESYRQDGAYYLPQGYTYEQWESDVRRWEQETGLSYDQYIRSQNSRGRALPSSVTQRPALPSRVSEPSSSSYGGAYQPQQPPQQQQQPGGWPGAQRQQQQQQQPWQQQPAYNNQLQRPMRTSQQVDTRYRGPAGPPSTSPYGAGGGAPGAPAGRPMQQPGMGREAQGPMQQPAQRPMAPQQGAPQQAAQPMQRPGAKPRQPQQPPMRQPADGPAGSVGPASPVGPAAGPEPAARRRMDEYVVPDRARQEEYVEQALPAGWQQEGSNGSRQGNYR